jgi:hypothetical protein
MFSLDEILKSDDYTFKIKCLIGLIENEARKKDDEVILEKAKELLLIMLHRDLEEYQKEQNRAAN